MTLREFTRPKAAEPPPKPKQTRKGIIVLAVIAALLGGVGWYYFFGRKPVVALSISIPAKGDPRPGGLWGAGPGQIALYANGELKLVDLGERKEKWSVKVPSEAAIDSAWQDAVNARFVKLQQWADELAQERAALTSAAQIKTFNVEAAKYHVELTSARAEAAKPHSAPQPPPRGATAEPANAAASEHAPLGKLNAIVPPEVRIIEERVKKRAAKLDAWEKTLDAKTAGAKTDFQKKAAKEEAARYEAELAEQKRDQDSLEKARGSSVPEKIAEQRPSAERADDFGTSQPQVEVCGDRLWLFESHHAVAFDRASGTVRADVPLAGRALQMFLESDAVVVVAAAGDGAVQVTKLSASAPPQSLYFPTGRREHAFVAAWSATTPNVQERRCEFSAAGGGIAMADIRLKEKRIKVRDAIRQSSEKELESTAGNAAAHSEAELKAVSSLLSNDSAKLVGDGKERVDESTYDITLRRPFDPTVPAWTGAMQGRVQLFSTQTTALITAGTKLIAVDRANKKLWEATLGAPVPIRRSDDDWDSLPPPWLELGERLFFADGAFLTALQSKTGQVLWRLPGIGIRKLQTDADGNLYVLSDNLHVQALTYVLDESLRDSVPLVLKIDAATGKIAWQAEKYQNLWVSGKDVYAFRETKNAGDVETQVFDPAKAVEARVKIYKLSRRDGGPMWEWFQPRRPGTVVVDGKSVALLFRDELQIIRSICW